MFLIEKWTNEILVTCSFIDENHSEWITVTTTMYVDKKNTVHQCVVINALYIL